MTRPRAQDLLLALLLVVTLGLSAYAVLRDPTPPTDAARVSLPSSPATPTASPTPAPAPAPVLLLAPPDARTEHVAAAGRALRWDLTGPLPLQPGAAELTSRLRGQRLVVVQAAEGQAREAAVALREVRAAAPAIRLVLVGPLGLDGDQLEAERALLRDAAPQADADFVDPVGSRWREGLSEAGQAGELSAADAQALGARLATALRRAESVRATPMAATPLAATPGAATPVAATPGAATPAVATPAAATSGSASAEPTG